MPEQHDARWRDVQRVREVPVGGCGIRVHAGFAGAALARTEASIVVGEEVYAEVAEPRVELRPAAVADVAVVAVRYEDPGYIWCGASGGDDPRREGRGIGGLERDGSLVQCERSVRRIY